MPKSTPASSTNHDTKECYPVYSNYNGMIEFSKALRCYYSESTAESRAEVYEPYKGDFATLSEIQNVTKDVTHNEGDNSLKTNQDVIKTYQDVNISKDDMLTINSHIIKLLDETFKKEVNKNVILQQEAKRYKERISTLERNIQDKTLENVMLDKRLKELDRAEKNRKDPKHREQLLKFSLLILFGILLYSISEYL